MKRRSFLSVVLAAFIPTSLITSETSAPPQTVDLTAFVEDEFAPYVITGTIKNTKTGVSKTFHKSVTCGTFKKTLTYPTGHNWTLDISLTTARAGSPNGYLQINDRVAKINGYQGVIVLNFVA